MSNLKDKIKKDFKWLNGLKSRLITSTVLSLICLIITSSQNNWSLNDDIYTPTVKCFIISLLSIYIFTAWLYGANVENKSKQ